MHAELVVRVVRQLLHRHQALRGRQRTGDQSELADLVQETFTRAFSGPARRRYDGSRDYQPFLRNIARNVTIDHLRRARVHLPLDRVEMLEAIPANHLTDDGDPRMLSLLQRRVTSLPPELRCVHDAIYVDGLSQREAAAALGLGRQTVRTRDARLRHVLRRELTSSGVASVG